MYNFAKFQLYPLIASEEFVLIFIRKFNPLVAMANNQIDRIGLK